MQVRTTLRNTLQQVHWQDRAFAAHGGKDCVVAFLVSLHAYFPLHIILHG